VKKIVVIGGGHAAAQFCASLIEAKCEAQLVLVSDDTHLPYQRPPLSKTYLKDEQPAPAWLRGESYYTDNGADVHLEARAVAIDRQARTVQLHDGRTLPYDQLVLATGTRARRLPMLAESHDNVHTLRSLGDAARLRRQLHEAANVVVIGGGFIGLEIAATAGQLGKKTTVLEAADRLLGRSASPEVSAYLLRKHGDAGVDIRLGAAVDRVEAQEGRVTGVWVGQDHFPADVLVIGIGAEPNDELAREAGLDCDNGIVVDDCMRTSDPNILAIGDCTAFPSAWLGRRIRLESVQNANDQARCAVLCIKGEPQPYSALPWFWSDQGGVRLQIAGVPDSSHRRVLRGDPSDDKFSVLYFSGDGTLSCVESINAAPDHMAARKLIAGRKPIPEDQAADASVPLKTLDQA